MVVHVTTQETRIVREGRNLLIKLVEPKNVFLRKRQSDLVDDAVADSLGAMRLPDDRELFDLPEQRMSEPVAEAGDGKRPVRLTPEGLGRVIQAFEKKMSSELHHPAAGERLCSAEATTISNKENVHD